MLISVEGVAVSDEAVEVGVLPGLNDSPAGSADAVGDVAAVKEHALVGDAVHVGSGDAGGVVCAEGLLAVVVGKDEEDIRPLGGGGPAEGGEGEEGEC